MPATVLERSRTPKRPRNRRSSGLASSLKPEIGPKNVTLDDLGKERSSPSSPSSDLASSDVESSCPAAGREGLNDRTDLVVKRDVQQKIADALATQVPATACTAAGFAALIPPTAARAAAAEHSSSGCSSVSRKFSPGFAALWLDDVGLEDDSTYGMMFGMFTEGLLQPGISPEIAERFQSGHHVSPSAADHLQPASHLSTQLSFHHQLHQQGAKVSSLACLREDGASCYVVSLLYLWAGMFSGRLLSGR